MGIRDYKKKHNRSPILTRHFSNDIKISFTEKNTHKISLLDIKGNVTWSENSVDILYIISEQRLKTGLNLIRVSNPKSSSIFRWIKI